MFMHNQNKIDPLLYTEKIRLGLMQSVIRACFRADKDTREAFEVNGNRSVFATFSEQSYMSLCIPKWENLSVANKRQLALRAKARYNVKNFHYDQLRMNCVIRYPDTHQIQQLQVDIFNYQGFLMKNTDWNKVNFYQLISYYRYDMLSHMSSTYAKDAFTAHFDQICVKFLSTNDEAKINFFKRFIWFLIRTIEPNAKNDTIISNGWK